MTETVSAQILTPWQPAICKEWFFDQIKYHYDVILGKMLQNSDQSPDDIEVPYLKAQHVQWHKVQIADLPTMWASPNEIEVLQIREGDLIVCEGGEVGRAAIVSEQPPESCIIQNALHLVRPKPTGDVRFLRYLLQHATSHAWLDVLCNRATIAHFTSEKFREMWVWLPPLAQQRIIADYLDRETARIDTLITAKQRLLDLLAEKRRVIITHAVTRGLDANAPLRDSGVEWLGEIPAHWEIVHLRRVLELMDYGISESVDIEGEIAVLRMGDISEGRISFDNVGFVSQVDSQLLLLPGDLLFNRTNSLEQVGKVGIFQGNAPYPVSFASYLVRMRCGDMVIPEYLNYLLNSAPILAWARSEALPSIGQANLNPNRYSYLPIPIPPKQEQQVIVKYLHTETQWLDNLGSAMQKTIMLLHERRIALIAAAVTGKLQVESLCN